MLFVDLLAEVKTGAAAVGIFSGQSQQSFLLLCRQDLTDHGLNTVGADTGNLAALGDDSAFCGGLNGPGDPGLSTGRNIHHPGEDVAVVFGTVGVHQSGICRQLFSNGNAGIIGAAFLGNIYR